MSAPATAERLHSARPDVGSARLPTTYFVIQRRDGHWTTAAKIVAVFETEIEAEKHAGHLKGLHPHQHFGVAALRSEARHVPKPIEIVRAQ